MKLQLTPILIICTLFINVNTALYVNFKIQQPQTERHFNDGFKDSYSGRKYNYEGKEAVGSKSSKKGKSSKYSENKPYVKEENATDNFSFNFNAFNWLFIIILIIAVIFLAYTLLNDGRSSLFSSRKDEKINSYGEITADNIAHADIKSLIDNAEKKNDYRLAIRYYYLLVLKQLTLKNLITYADDKTNADYINAMTSQKFSKDFAYTSYIYNYTWYGEFSLDVKQYELAKSSFVQLIKEVNS